MSEKIPHDVIAPMIETHLLAHELLVTNGADREVAHLALLMAALEAFARVHDPLSAAAWARRSLADIEAVFTPPGLVS